MRILGVDPGTRIVGFGCLELRARKAAGNPGQGSAGATKPRELPMAHRVSNRVEGGGPAAIDVLTAGAWRLGTSGAPIEQRLAKLAAELRAVFAEFHPDTLALEEAYFGKSVQSALRVGEARGVVLAEAHAAGVAVEQFPPARIKRVVTGSGAAGKERVAEMVRVSLRLSAPPETLDVTDALAVGLCCIEENRRFRFGAG